MRKILAALAFLFILTAAPVRLLADDIDDYYFVADFDVGAVSDVAVTPDDRYVLILDGDSNKLHFLDTWDFDLIEGASVDFGSDSPLCLDISPDGDYAYIGLDSGELAIVDISGLYSLSPIEEPEDELTVYFKTIDGDGALEKIAAVPNYNSPTSDPYIIMGFPSSAVEAVYWVKHSGGSSLTTALAFPSHSVEVIELERGEKQVFEIYESSGNDYLGIIQCDGTCTNTNGIDKLVTPSTGLAADPINDDFLVISYYTQSGSTPLGSIQYLDTSSFDSQTVESEEVGISSTSIAILSSGLNDSTTTALFLTDQNAEMTEINNSTLAATSGTVASPSTDNFSALAASSGNDRFFYAGTDGASNSFHVFTANPWISYLTANAGATVTEADGDEFPLAFSAFKRGSDLDFDVYVDGDFGSWSGSVADGEESESAAGDTVAVVINVAVDDLDECENVLTVVAEDSAGREGRDAVKVVKDFPPPEPDFSLDFGDRKLIIEFNVDDPCDLKEYVIFYGDSATLDNSFNDYDDLLASGADYVTLDSGLTDGKKIKETIEGLTNGVLHYVYLVIVDKSDNSAVSDARSATPQVVLTLTDLTGEEGGVDCFGSLGGARTGDPKSAAVLLAPLLMAAAYSSIRRWKK